MIGYVQKKFAFSAEGAKDFITSVFWTALLNISFMFPSIYAFVFIRKLLPGALSGSSVEKVNLFISSVVALALMLVIYLVAIKQYDVCYTRIYGEAAKRRISLAEKLRKLPLAFFGKRDIADLSATIMDDTTQIENLFSHTVPQLYGSIISAGIICAMLLIYDWRMGLALLWVVPFSFLIFALSRKLQKRSHQSLYKTKRRIADSVQEGVDMVSELKAANYERQYAKSLNRLLDDYENQQIKSELVIGSLLNISVTLMKLGLVSVVLIGALLYAKETIDLFTMIVFMVVSAGIYQPFLQTMENMAALIYLSTRIDRMKEMDALPVQEGSTSFWPQHYDIEFNNVEFSYEEDQQTINGISFIAKQGEVTALVGPSGGGKTTVAKLAARFWDIDRGKILLGGKDISQLDPETLLKSYAIVFQDVVLFNFSVMENIRVGKKGASDEEVLRAAKLAQCDEFVKKLPDGYATLIGENGEKLSGGERQRISIARAILKDAPIILLDEATASLDAENESKIQEALSALIAEKTVLIIAHRMRTVMGADKIVVIREGEIVESGSPTELMKRGGVFAAMNAKPTGVLTSTS